MGIVRYNLQQPLNILADALGLIGGGVAFHDPAGLIDEEFGEIPFDSASEQPALLCF